MKKKIFLFLIMFLFITNVKALTFNVNITNIEDEGNNGTIGSIERIDIPNKELDVLFQDIGDEVNFSITVTNSGNRAGTLRNITVEGTNDKIEYTTNLPENGLAINGNDTNEVIVKGKLLPGAVKGKTSSQIKINYNYDEGSCPEGEILTEDESMCLCPEGYERNENGICVKPEEDPECEDDEIYNETKKICEKKIVPVVPSNPKTLDNIILITLLFIVSGLGIYAVLFKKLKTSKKRVTVGAIIGVLTLGTSLTVLISVFGLESLLGAIVNPITKSKVLIVTVNEEIDLIETWDGECSLETTSLTPENIFEGGTGTQSDPYKIKTAEQLSCFAKSINNGTTYQGQYVKQIKNIKLNDNLLSQAEGDDLSHANVWTAAGNTNIVFDDNAWDHVTVIDKSFNGTYDGDNHVISGLYISTTSSEMNQDTWGNTIPDFKGLFGVAVNATIKNLVLSDIYMDPVAYNDSNYAYDSHSASLLGYGLGSITLDNIKTYGEAKLSANSGGVVSEINGIDQGILTINNVENNINMDFGSNNYNLSGGVIGNIYNFPESNSPNINITNVTNNGTKTKNNSSAEFGGVIGSISGGNLLANNVANNGNIDFKGTAGSTTGGVFGTINTKKVEITNSYNTGNFINPDGLTESGGVIGSIVGSGGSTTLIDNCYNSGNIMGVNVYPDDNHSWGRGRSFAGIVGYLATTYTISNSYNTGKISMNSAYVGGILGDGSYEDSIINRCFNRGKITGPNDLGGIAALTYDVTNSYNKGEIVFFGQNSVGGITGYRAHDITNSYNEGDITITSNSREAAALAAGIAGGDSNKVENCYNRGNITSYNASLISGIAYATNLVKNSYNSGNITFTDELGGTNAKIAGITYNGALAENAYNLGNIMAHQKEVNVGDENIHLSGIIAGGHATNSVNAGNITLKMDSPYTRRHVIQIGGISDWGDLVNNFNSGTLSIDNSALQTPIENDEFNHTILFGEIVANGVYNSSGNKFTKENGIAAGCYLTGTCTLEESQAVGTYSSEEVPSILSIINVGNAFEITQGETLPTLKVFNE